MHRLSLKRFVVLVSAIGLVFGFMPTASAHKDTGSAGPVTGTVTWPVGPKSDFDLPRGIESTDLSLDARAVGSGATREGGLLNGCRLAGGNTGPEAGLPLGTLGGPKPGDDPLDPNSTANNPPRTYNQHDLCFTFEDTIITSSGLWEGRKHATQFGDPEDPDVNCESSGTSGASGALGSDPTANGGVLPTFGAFYGEFVCDGIPLSDQKGYIPRADGHFHGLSVGGTTIAFLGEIHCSGEQESMPKGDPDACPKALDNTGKDVEVNHGKPVNESRIKHTLACKGEVAPVPPGDAKLESVLDQTGGLGNTVTTAAVVLECVIA